MTTLGFWHLTHRILFVVLPLVMGLASVRPAHALDEVLVSVSIDYEGQKITRENIDAMVAFRKKHPKVRFIHFLNAASYTVPGADAAETTRLLKQVINPEIDEIGLHIHPRRSLVEAAGVKFRVGPTYLGDADPKYFQELIASGLMPWDRPPVTPPTVETDFGEEGNDVPFWAYTKEEQLKIILKSLELLAANGFTGIISFRAGGWSASPETWWALAAAGIYIDSSAVPAGIIRALYSKSNLMHFNQIIWKGITSSSQPYTIDLGGKAFFQFPNNGGLADYQSPQDFFAAYLNTVREHDGQSRAVVHVGFHLETAAEYLPNLSGGYTLMEDHAKKNNIILTPATFKSSLKLAKRSRKAGYINFGSAQTCESVFK